MGMFLTLCFLLWVFLHAVLCDNESFLSTARSKQAHANARLCMWHIPPRSPDLNPIEKYWAWLRKSLLARDLSDAVAKRPALDKAGYVHEPGEGHMPHTACAVRSGCVQQEPAEDLCGGHPQQGRGNAWLKVRTGA